MRISFQQHLPGYVQPPFRGVITFNGIRVGDVVSADEESGEIVTLTRNERGEFLVDREKDEIVLTTHSGLVRIFPRKD